MEKLIGGFVGGIILLVLVTAFLPTIFEIVSWGIGVIAAFVVLIVLLRRRKPHNIHHHYYHR
jgi:cytosine/uracil/thiamine/allantoin permease